MSETTTCFHHANRETGRSCTRCGRKACPECLHTASVGSQCFECIKAAAPPKREQIRRWNAMAEMVVTKALIGTNIAAFLLMAGPGPARFALTASSVASGEWYRLITSGFVHFGLLHIAFNMYALYQLGMLLEAPLGRVRFLGLYLASLLGGALGALLLSPDALTGGASGAIFGLFGAAFVGFRMRGISVWQTGIGTILVINLVMTFAISGISIGGHLGGLAVGTVCGSVMFRTGLTRRSMLQGLAFALAVGAAAAAVAIWVASHS